MGSSLSVCSRTLADAATLQPGARGIPHKLLPVLLDGDVEGVPDVRVVEVPHAQDLRNHSTHTHTQALKGTAARMQGLAAGGMHPPLRHLQDELLLDALRAVDALHLGVGAAVLDGGSLEVDFPFEHGHHKVPIQEGVGLAIR